MFPIYFFGSATAGNVTDQLILTGVSLGLFLITYFIISSTFVKLMTYKRHAKRKKYVAKTTKKNSVDACLLKKDFKIFGHYTVYLVNAGLGIALMLIILILAIVFRDSFINFLPLIEQLGVPISITGIIVVTSIGFCAGMDIVTTPAVSMEGNNFWLLKSLPLNPLKILYSKVNVHMIVNSIPSVICVFAITFMFTNDLTNSLVLIPLIIAYIQVTAQFGIIIGTKRAKLN